MGQVWAGSGEGTEITIKQGSPTGFELGMSRVFEQRRFEQGGV